MKKTVLTLLVLIIASLSVIVVFDADAAVRVNGYFRKNGTYVQPHYRSNPDGNPYNNWSYPGNTNPYTGKVAPGSPSIYLNNYYGGTSYPSSLPSYNSSSGLSQTTSLYSLPKILSVTKSDNKTFTINGSDFGKYDSDIDGLKIANTNIWLPLTSIKSWSNNAIVFSAPDNLTSGTYYINIRKYESPYGYYSEVPAGSFTLDNPPINQGYLTANISNSVSNNDAQKIADLQRQIHALISLIETLKKQYNIK